MIVGARQAGLSISETAKLLGFSRTTVSRVYSEWSQLHKTSSERQFCGRKRLVDERGQQKMVRLVRDNRNATVTQITSQYNRDEKNGISERTARRTLRLLGFNKKTNQVPPLPAKKRKLEAAEGDRLTKTGHLKAGKHNV